MDKPCRILSCSLSAGGGDAAAVPGPGDESAAAAAATGAAAAVDGSQAELGDATRPGIYTTLRATHEREEPLGPVHGFQRDRAMVSESAHPAAGARPWLQRW
jgi:hypothetical protein